MKRMDVRIEIPYYVFSFKGSYTKVERPTGLQYMLLMMIDSNFTKSMTWGDVISQFKIPADIFKNMLVPIMENQMKEMLDIDNEITLESRVSDISLTPEGKDALGKEIIAERSDTFDGKATYIPAYNDNVKLTPGTDILANCDLVESSSLPPEITFENVDTSSQEFDQEIENLVRLKKKEYSLDSESEITNVDVTERSAPLFFEIKASLVYDEKTGSFSFESPFIDDTFIKSYYTADYFLSKVDGSIFQINNKALGDIEWRSEIPDLESCDVLLPSQLKVYNAMAMINSRMENPTGMFTFEGDCDLLCLESDGSGYGYYFVVKGASLSGFEGSAMGRYVVKKGLSREECSELVKKALATATIRNDDKLKQAIRYIKASCDEAYLESFMREQLIKIDNIPATVAKLKEYGDDGWFCSAVESAIAGTSETIEDLDALLSSVKVNIDGRVIADMMWDREGVDHLQLIDTLLFRCKTDRASVYTARLSDDYCRMILGDYPQDTREYRSTVMNEIVNVSIALSNLKTMLNIVSFSQHSFNLEELAKSGKDIGRMIDTFLVGVKRIRQYIRGSKYYGDVDRYRAFFEDIRDVFVMDEKTKQDNARLFAVTKGPLLESILKTITEGGTLTEMLEYVHERNIITEPEYRTLIAFRDFRNKCAHDMVVGTVEKSELKRWGDAIEAVRQRITEEDDGK